MQIIVKKYSDSMRFKPHMNYALGKYIHTKKDYKADMKKGGFIPYDSNRDYSPKRKKYQLQKDTKEMIAYISRNKDEKGGVMLSSSFLDALEKKKKGFGKALIDKKKYFAEEEKMSKGGFFERSDDAVNFKR